MLNMVMYSIILYDCIAFDLMHVAYPVKPVLLYLGLIVESI